MRLGIAGHSFESMRIGPPIVLSYHENSENTVS